MLKKSQFQHFKLIHHIYKYMFCVLKKWFKHFLTFFLGIVHKFIWCFFIVCMWKILHNLNSVKLRDFNVWNCWWFSLVHTVLTVLPYSTGMNIFHLPSSREEGRNTWCPGRRRCISRCGCEWRCLSNRPRSQTWCETARLRWTAQDSEGQNQKAYNEINTNFVCMNNQIY